jgi:hypothetical protein
MGFDQRRRHGQRVIQIRQRGARKLHPHVQHLLRRRLDRFFLARGWRRLSESPPESDTRWGGRPANHTSH